MSAIKRRHLMQIMAGSFGAPPLFAAEVRGASLASFENEHLRVVRLRFSPGTIRPTHYVPPSLMVYLTDSTARFTRPAGKNWQEKVLAGEVRWWPGGEVRVEILSNQKVEFLQVIPK